MLQLLWQWNSFCLSRWSNRDSLWHLSSGWILTNTKYVLIYFWYMWRMPAASLGRFCSHGARCMYLHVQSARKWLPLFPVAWCVALTGNPYLLMHVKSHCEITAMYHFDSFDTLISSDKSIPSVFKRGGGENVAIRHEKGDSTLSMLIKINKQNTFSCIIESNLPPDQVTWTSDSQFKCQL